MRTPTPPTTINKAATKLISLQGSKRPRNNLSAKSFSAITHSVRNSLPLCNMLFEALRFLTRKLVREGSGQPPETCREAAVAEASAGVSEGPRAGSHAAPQTTLLFDHPVVQRTEWRCRHGSRSASRFGRLPVA